MTFPVFASGDVLNSSDMNAVGLWLVKTQTVGTGVSSVTVSSAFSADFDNYRIIYSGGTCSSAGAMWIQLGSSTTGYYGTLIYNSISAGTPTGAANNNNNRADWCGGMNANQHAHFSVDLLGPYSAIYTKIRNGQYQDTDAFGTYNGEHKVATSYTGFTIGPSNGTLTGGTIRVYGYRN